MTGKIYYRKLIRDAIPEKIAKAGAECEVRKMDDREYESELLKKVGEEASALPVVTTRDELIEEIADVQDVLEEIKRFKNITDEEIGAAQKKAFEKKGGFAKRLFLEWSSDDGYKTNEQA